MFARKNFIKIFRRIAAALPTSGAQTLAKGPDSSYAIFLTSKTHTILIAIIVTPSFVISRIISL